jgi:hypothetical protein
VLIGQLAMLLGFVMMSPVWGRVDYKKLSVKRIFAKRSQNRKKKKITRRR